MANHLKQSGKIITELINSEPGIKYNFESKIEAIKELPINNFSEIRKLLTSGKAIIRIAPISVDSTTFNLISTPLEKRLSTLFSSIIIIGPIAGIALSIIYSWYWSSLVLIAPIFSIKMGKRVYLHALFNRAFNSETIFSYLFTAGKITIELPEHGILYRNIA
ncbi:hypothetical protein KAR91_36515 [Candidatus Pacearchaeota archaeon]|nr:hypothetical protein [Candidatus Pacearchaeota archaeon]